MKIINFVIFVSAIANLASASMEYRAGRNYMWTDKSNGQVGTTVYNFGVTSFDNTNLNHLNNLGYSQTIKSPLQDKWKFDKNGTTGTVTIGQIFRCLMRATH